MVYGVYVHVTPLLNNEVRMHKRTKALTLRYEHVTSAGGPSPCFAHESIINASEIVSDSFERDIETSHALWNPVIGLVSFGVL